MNDNTLTGCTKPTTPNLQNIPIRTEDMDAKLISQSFRTPKIHAAQVPALYAAWERSIMRLMGPRAPKRKRRKRLAKKIARRSGMLRTCGIVQSCALHRQPSECEECEGDGITIPTRAQQSTQNVSLRKISGFKVRFQYLDAIYVRRCLDE